MLAWLIFVAFRVVGHGEAMERTETHATANAKYNATTEMMISCQQRGGNNLSLVGFSSPADCITVGDLHRCSVDSSASCGYMEPAK